MKIAPGRIVQNLKNRTRGKMDKEVLLQQLLDACHDGRRGAIRLAQRPCAEPLKRILEEGAQHYHRAADEIRSVWKNDTLDHAFQRRGGLERAEEGDDVAACWERAECEALTYFRDAYDASLPPPIADAVKRHYEAGLGRLERLRRLRAGRRLT